MKYLNTNIIYKKLDLNNKIRRTVDVISIDIPFKEHD